jgi:hypothetical protein
VSHPNIGKFIQIIRNECEKTRIALKQVQEGEYIFLSEQNFVKEAKLKAI